MTCPSCSKEIPDISRFCLHCGKSIKSASGGATSSTRKAVALGVFLVLVAALLVYSRTKFKPGISGQSDLEKEIASPAFYPISEKLFTGQLVVLAGQYVERRLVIDPSKMLSPRAYGTFHTSGGSGNDIQVVVVEENDFENWAKGHEAHLLYSSGKTTNGTIDAHFTKAGTYYLALSNVFSNSADKTVFAEVELDYDARR